jgi:hypothetical protein
MKIDFLYELFVTHLGCSLFKPSSMTTISRDCGRLKSQPRSQALPFKSLLIALSHASNVRDSGLIINSSVEFKVKIWVKPLFVDQYL